jgi:hypothetical protein
MTDYAATETRVSTAGFELGAAGITPPSNPHRRGVFLADVVVELGLADQETTDQAQQAAQETERSLERYLLESGILDEEGLSRAIAERNGLDHVDLDQFEVDLDAAQMVARSAADRYRAVPVAFASDGALIVAVQDPYDTLGISDIEVMTRSAVRPAIATGGGIDALIQRLPEQAVSRPLLEAQETEKEEEVSELDETTIDPEEGANGAGPPVTAAFEEPQPPSEPELEPFAQAESLAEFGSEPVLEESQVESEPVLEDELEPIGEPDAVDSEFELVQFPEPDNEPDVVLDMKPELVQLPEPEVEASVGAASDLEGELGSLQETARRADELAATVERRITELKSGADERSAQLEGDLSVAERRIEELEARMSGVDTLAEELRATTAKLEEVNRVLEGSVR